jgi:hypothetical protein
MFAIHRHGSEEQTQKQKWLPRMAAGEVIGCFGLTEPDFGSDPAGMRSRARRDGSDSVLDGTKMAGLPPGSPARASAGMVGGAWMWWWCESSQGLSNPSGALPPGRKSWPWAGLAEP